MKKTDNKSLGSQLASMRWKKWKKNPELKEAHMKKMEESKQKYWEKKRKLDKKGKTVSE